MDLSSILRLKFYFRESRENQDKKKKRKKAKYFQTINFLLNCFDVGFCLF